MGAGWNRTRLIVATHRERLRALIAARKATFASIDIVAIAIVLLIL